MFVQKVIDDANGANMLYIICFIVISAVFVKILLLHFEGKRKRILASEIPGPAESFLIGSLSLVMQGPEKLITNFCNVYRMYEKSMFKFWIFNELYIVVTQPEDIEFVLINQKLLKKAKMYKIFEKSIPGQGIFTNNDIEKWKINRKTISDGLKFKSLKSFIPIFYEEANVLSELLQKKCANSNECNLIHPISMATFEIVGRATLGVSFNAQRDGHHRFIESVEAIMSIWEYRILYPWYLNEKLFRFSSIKRKHDRHKKIINEIVDETIIKRFDELSRNSNANRENVTETDDEDMGRKPKSLIEILLGHYPEMSFEQIRQEVITILIAGQDTAAFTMTCAIFVLAHHQEIQNKVFEELQSIFAVGDHKRHPTYEDLQQMKYLEQVIKETMRLFPAAPVFGRRLDEEMRIGKYLCPAGSTLVIFPLFINSSPLYYTDPDTFNPDNFLPDTRLSRNPYTFMSFSGGPRNCVGMRYAMFQMKTVLSTLVRSNTFFPSDRCPTMKHLRLKFSFTMKFVVDCHVKIEPRTLK